MGAAVVVLILGLEVALAVLWVRGRRAERRLRRAESSFRRLRGLQVEALALETTRGRFRRRQRGVEHAVATGTRGMESAHRSMAGRLGWPTGAGVYRRVRGLNRTLGRGVCRLFAPSTPSRSRESLAQWRARRDKPPGPEDEN